MSTQVFSVQVREAIWAAHGRRCLYCGRSLLYKELIIDHVIPEVTSRDELSVIIARIGLRPGFDIYNWENHAPCCYGCNKQKHDIPFHDALLSNYLQRVGNKLSQVEELVRKAKEDWDLDKVLRTIARDVEAGRYTHDELIRSVEIMKRFPHGIRGAGRPSPPASPEKRLLGIEFSGRPVAIRMSQSVRNYLADLNISTGLLAHHIETSVMSRHFNIKTVPGVSSSDLRTYLMRLDMGGDHALARVEFQVSDDMLNITRVESSQVH